MTPEWLPDWWTQSPAYQWLAGPGRWLLPSLMHAACLAIEINILRAYARLPYKEKAPAERSVWIVMMLHLLAFVVSLSAIDSGVFYYYGSGLWGVLAVLLAASAIRRLKHSTPEADSYERQSRPDFARLRGEAVPERTP
ncbi:MAG: hypothetical protein R3E76_06790 [Planctomycetota bacterium]